MIGRNHIKQNYSQTKVTFGRKIKASNAELNPAATVTTAMLQIIIAPI